MWLNLAAVVIPAVLAAGTAPAVDNARFLALGDSYTIGEGVAADERWPVQLVAALRHAGIALEDAEIVARTGWTTDELATAMDAHALRPPYALVTLMIGVNNQYRGHDLANYRSEFRSLLERAIELAGKRPQRVIVISIPDWGVTRFGRGSGRDTARIAREIDAYNAADVEIATMLHVGYIDVTAAVRAAGDDAGALTADGLHPSAAMYRRWAALILPQAQTALSSR